MQTLHSAARRALPFAADGEPDALWCSDTGDVVLVAWHNEPPGGATPLIVKHPLDGAAGNSGYLSNHELGADLVDRPEKRLSELGGVWSLFAATSAGLFAATSSSGAEPVFYAETPERAVVGNRALLVHLVAHPPGPMPDLVGLAGVFNAGYCVTDRTAFQGVRVLGAGRTLRVSSAGLALADHDVVGPGVTAVQIADALLDSVAPVAALNRPVSLGLTGGRDSRLVAALLTRAGALVTARTSGLPDDPDVVVATQVAEVLGIRHRVGPPMGAQVSDSTVTFDVRGRLKEAVVLGEGMLGAYDRVGRIDDKFQPACVAVTGGGGEILRGYFAALIKDVKDRAAAERFLRTRLFRDRRLYASDLLKEYDTDVAPWLERVRELGADALEEFYVSQRVARWTGAARGSASIGSLAWRPYLDHRVVRLVRAIPVANRVNESLIAALLDEFVPQLAQVRFAGKRWKFDKVPPKDPVKLADWEARAPVVGRHGDRADFNWRTDVPEVIAALRNVIMDAPADFWILADRRQVEALVTGRRHRSRNDVVRMWHMATVAASLASKFETGPDRLHPKSSTVVAARPGDRVRLRQRLENRAKKRPWLVALVRRY
ncbi:MAG: asparagine synthase-related protein [Actinomycetes bacterium]